MPDIRIDPKQVAAVLERSAERFGISFGPQEIGRVVEAGDGIAIVDGLPGVMVEEMVVFPREIRGMVMNLDRRQAGVVIFGDHSGIQQGDTVKRSGRVLDTPVGDALLGRVVTPLGKPVDGRGPLQATERRLVDTDGPGIAARQPVEVPLHTGIKSIDAMVPIGRGQRELIIGDRHTGKTTLAIDTILNQLGSDVICIYVSIGQKMANISRWVGMLRERGMMQQTVVVAAASADPAPLQYIAPFAACSIAEAFRDKGRHVLMVFDDLSKHAAAYREISLLLRRPPGREAFPGDVFYLHSRLLERAGCTNAELGGGTITALPIVETQQGDYSAYIPTNLVSITDGQIYLDGALFHQGLRPAVNAGLSVSRIGGKAQWPAMRKIGLRLRMDLAQYREQAAFAELTTDLDSFTVKQLHRGERLAEILKQGQHEPMPVERQVCIIWAAVSGHLDDLPLTEIERFQREWFGLLDSSYEQVCDTIRATHDLNDATEGWLRESVGQLKRMFTAQSGVPALDPQRIIPAPDEAETHLPQTAISTQSANPGGM